MPCATAACRHSAPTTSTHSQPSGARGDRLSRPRPRPAQPSRQAPPSRAVEAPRAVKPPSRASRARWSDPRTATRLLYDPPPYAPAGQTPNGQTAFVWPPSPLLAAPERHSARHSARHSQRHSQQHSETPLYKGRTGIARHRSQHRARHRSQHRARHTLVIIKILKIFFGRARTHGGERRRIRTPNAYHPTRVQARGRTCAHARTRATRLRQRRVAASPLRGHRQTHRTPPVVGGPSGWATGVAIWRCRQPTTLHTGTQVYTCNFLPKCAKKCRKVLAVQKKRLSLHP